MTQVTLESPTKESGILKAALIVVAVSAVILGISFGLATLKGGAAEDSTTSISTAAQVQAPGAACMDKLAPMVDLIFNEMAAGGNGGSIYRSLQLRYGALDQTVSQASTFAGQYYAVAHELGIDKATTIIVGREKQYCGAK